MVTNENAPVHPLDAALDELGLSDMQRAMLYATPPDQCMRDVMRADLVAPSFHLDCQYRPAGDMIERLKYWRRVHAPGLDPYIFAQLLKGAYWYRMHKIAMN